jgi:hypothetical protein
MIREWFVTVLEIPPVISPKTAVGGIHYGRCQKPASQIAD